MSNTHTCKWKKTYPITVSICYSVKKLPHCEQSDLFLTQAVLFPCHGLFCVTWHQKACILLLYFALRREPKLTWKYIYIYTVCVFVWVEIDHWHIGLVNNLSIRLDGLTPCKSYDHLQHLYLAKVETFYPKNAFPPKNTIIYTLSAVVMNGPYSIFKNG